MRLLFLLNDLFWFFVLGKIAFWRTMRIMTINKNLVYQKYKTVSNQYQNKGQWKLTIKELRNFLSKFSLCIFFLDLYSDAMF